MRFVTATGYNCKQNNNENSEKRQIQQDQVHGNSQGLLENIQHICLYRRLRTRERIAFAYCNRRKRLERAVYLYAPAHTKRKTKKVSQPVIQSID